MGDSAGEHEFGNSRLSRSAGTSDDIFVTTRWTVVLAAVDQSEPEAERALEELCKTYWFPLYAYIRRRGHSPEDAEDLAQEFFRQLLEHHWIEDADREKGRLRAFLITVLKRFMANEWRKASAQKRGGGRTPLSIDSGVAEGRYASAVKSPSVEAEKVFDHQWAITLLELTLRRLKNEYADSGKSDVFAALKDGLFLDGQSIDYPAMADKLGNTEGALRVTVHRMRKRFRELYREEVAQTLPQGARLDDEMRYLAESLARN
jgi:RNA polymerase sigma-70 factor (ECF subfamily)